MKFSRKPSALLLNLLLIVWAMLYYYPIRTTFYRAAIVLTLGAILVCVSVLVWPRRRWRFLPLALAAMLALVLLLPGRAANPAALRAAYITALRSYTRTKYVWGGENGRGVDCSGLLRAALIDAHWHEALRTCNPALARNALWLWWHDASARDMSDGYQGCTYPIGDYGPLKDLAPSLRPGDFTVTTDGSHVLTSLGDGNILEADPVTMIVMELDANSPWWRIKVMPCRWRCLE